MSYRVLGLSSSARPLARTTALLSHVLGGFPSTFDTELIEVSSLNLPQYSPTGGYSESSSLSQYSTLIAEADAILLASPVYQSSYSGVLKNALDHIHDMPHTPVGLIGKTIGTIAVAEGSEYGRCLAHLQTVASAMGGTVVPTPLGTSAASFEENVLRDPSVSTRAQILVRDIADRVRAQTTSKESAS